MADNFSSSSSTHEEENESKYFLLAGIFSLGLLVALLLSIFVSSSRFFRHWLHESLAVLLLGTGIGAIGHFLWDYIGLGSFEILFAPGFFSRICLSIFLFLNFSHF